MTLAQEFALIYITTPNLILSVVIPMKLNTTNYTLRYLLLIPLVITDSIYTWISFCWVPDNAGKQLMNKQIQWPSNSTIVHELMGPKAPDHLTITIIACGIAIYLLLVTKTASEEIIEKFRKSKTTREITK